MDNNAGREALSPLPDISPLEQNKRQAEQHGGKRGQHSGVTPVHAVDERVAAQVVVERRQPCNDPKGLR